MPTVECPRATIWYEVTNFGPPWQTRTPILLHHGLALNADFWYGWLPILAAKHPVVRLDLRGHGRSTTPQSEQPWLFEDLAKEALAVLDAAGYRRCHFVGESAGGTLGMYLAIHYPDRLASLTAVSATHQGNRVRNLDGWTEMLANEGVAGWSRMMMDRRFDPATVDRELAAWYATEQAKIAPAVILAIKDALVTTDLTKDLPSITVPTLLITPEGSPFVGPELMEEAHALIPRSEIAYVRGARHGLINSHPAECARLVVEFLRRRTSVHDRS